MVRTNLLACTVFAGLRPAQLSHNANGSTSRVIRSNEELVQERPAEQDGFVEDLDRLAEQVVGQVGLAAIDPGPDLGPGPHFLDAVAREVVLAGPRR